MEFTTSESCRGFFVVYIYIHTYLVCAMSSIVNCKQVSYNNHIRK
ncbi:hypothetical protein BIW11_12139, partial [Tropilaelaps mercedesae]